MEITTNSANETRAAGKQFAKGIKAGDIIALFGDLGSGKTTFTQGVAEGLGITEPITSPTFVFSKRYSSEDGTVIHFDCYRVGSREDAESIGLLEDLSSKENIIIIEWPENISEILPASAKKIYFQYLDESKRKIEIK